MKDDQHIEKIYDLVEIFDFNDLSENDKTFVLQHITLMEYNELRSTITDTQKLLLKYPDNVKKYKQFQLKKIALYPIELYKIAAIILIIIAAFYLLTKWDHPDSQNLIASVDTVFVKKTDTILVYVGDAVMQIKEKSNFSGTINQDNTDKHVKSFVNKEIVRDCSKELCPDDIQKLNALKTKNDFSEDTILTDFIVSIN
jgi:hypothetical protein